jgi:hypothetical protein
MDHLPLPDPDVVRMAKKTVHFNDIIEDAALKQLFIDFLEAEMMHENFLFWLDVEEYKSIKDPDQRKSFFNHVYDKYLGPNAELEMCIAGRRRAFIESNRENPPVNVFDNVQHDVFVAMSQECVPRFCRSELYLSYLVNKPDSPRTRFSRQKLQEFFGMELHGLLYRVELVQVVQAPGYERSNRKRKRQRKMPELKKMSDKFADPCNSAPSNKSSSSSSNANTRTPTHSSSTPQKTPASTPQRRGERK